MEMFKVIKTIEKIKNSVGNEKIQLMINNPELKKILEYAYNPFKKYYMSAPDSKGTFDSSKFDGIPYNELDDLSTRKLSGKIAFKEISDSISLMSKDSAEVFKMIINKDFRCGINIKTINKAFPNLIPLVYDGSEKPPVMLLKTFDPKRIKYPCLVAVKKDGVRARNIREMVSRSGHKLIGHTHIEDQLIEYPHDFDGELCVPGFIFDEASGLIRNDDPVPNSVYWVFDVPSIPGTKQQRWDWLRNNLKKTDSIKLIQHYWVKSELALMNFYSWALKTGEEGIVIYDPDSKYEDKRSHDWMRLVPIKSADCKVIGFFEGNGKWVGMLGGIIVDYKGHEVRVGTGFKEKILKNQLKQLVSPIDKKILTMQNKKVTGYSIEQISSAWWNNRQFIWDNKDLFLGAIAKLEFKEKTKAGSMRHPRFKTWRWDKCQ